MKKTAPFGRGSATAPYNLQSRDREGAVNVE